LKELSKLHLPVLEFSFGNKKVISSGTVNRLQILTLGFWKGMLFLLMEIHEHLEHTDSIVLKSWVKRGLYLLAASMDSNQISSDLKTSSNEEL
jgi:hypothetical protein